MAPQYSEDESVIYPVSREKLASLPRWALVALAARCAMRVAPLFKRRPQRAYLEFEAVEICSMAAMWLSARGPSDTAARAAAYALSIVMDVLEDFSPDYPGAHAAQAAAFACGTVHVVARILVEEQLRRRLTLRELVGDATYSAFGATKSSVQAIRVYDDQLLDQHSSGSGPRQAIVADFDLLESYELGRPYKDGRAVPREFFERALWVDDGNIPLDWRAGALNIWRDGLLELDRPDIFERHEKMLRGDRVA